MQVFERLVICTIQQRSNDKTVDASDEILGSEFGLTARLKQCKRYLQRAFY